jgi:hypothetical protein
MATETSWRMWGDTFEACSCNVTCPCNFGGDPTQEQVPINFETVNGEPRVTVPGLLEVGTERIPNPLPGQPPLDTKVSDIAVPLYAGPVNVRRSSVLKLTDPNLSCEYSGRSSLSGQFDYRGP